MLARPHTTETDWLVPAAFGGLAIAPPFEVGGASRGPARRHASPSGRNL